MAAKLIDLEKRRYASMKQYAIKQALERLDAEHPGFRPEPCVALIAAYEEEGNIGPVLEKMPETCLGEKYTTVVIVDGGDDRTAEICRTFPDVIVIEFPVNLGHGVALQVGYRFCIERGAQYIVTLDADGQNDPVELPTLIQDIVEDKSDFVLASRRLGVDTTENHFRAMAATGNASQALGILDRLDALDAAQGKQAT